MKLSVHEGDLFILHDALVLMTANETITWMRQYNYFHIWLLPMNGLQNGTPYDGRPVDNIPEFLPLNNSLNIDILHYLRFNCVLSHFVLDGEGTNKQERIMRFSFSIPKESSRGLKRIQESKMVTPSSARIIKDVDLTLKVLKIVYCTNGAVFKGIADRNRHRQKLVSKGKIVSWGGARTKGKGRD